MSREVCPCGKTALQCPEEGTAMSSDAIMLNEILENLDEEDYRIAITFLQYLSDMKKKKKQRKVTRFLPRYKACFQMTKGGTTRNKCWQIWPHSERDVWVMKIDREFKEKLLDKWPKLAENVYNLYH